MLSAIWLDITLSTNNYDAAKKDTSDLDIGYTCRFPFINKYNNMYPQHKPFCNYTAFYKKLVTMDINSPNLKGHHGTKMK